MFNTYNNKKQYINCMNALKKENQSFINLSNNNAFQKQLTYEKIKKAIKSKDLKMVRNFANHIITQLKLRKCRLNSDLPFSENVELDNYFFNQRIAVYTCIFGQYDKILEPLVVPDNCDYYIVTDVDIPKDSCWEPIKIDEKAYGIENLTPAQKNRYFKMHPHVLFKDYQYSVYIDGNIKIITDPTAFINRIGKYGIAMHKHSKRDCVYDEIIVCDIYKRDTIENLKKQKQLLMSENMPKHYGMCECNIIARHHNDVRVVNLMEQWWNYYMQYSKRDQLSFPLVLYKNGISVSDVGTLGSNVNKNYAVRVVRHEIMQIFY